MNVAAPTEGDLDEMLRVASEADRAVYGDTDWTDAELRAYFEETDPESDMWVVRLDGRLAGWAAVEDRGGGRLVADGYVDPGLFGRGVGSALLDVTERRARERVTEAGSPLRLQNATLNQDERTRELYRSRGYEEARWFWRMVVRLDGPPPAPVVPEGLRIEPFEPESARPVHAAFEESFAEEWDHHPQAFEEFEQSRLRPPRFRPDLWLTAWDGGEVAGILLGDWKRLGDWGWIANVGVRPAWRGRGLGLALLHASFGRFWELGERVVALGVDVDNPTGATRLYERAGMRRLWEAVLWEKELHP